MRSWRGQGRLYFYNNNLTGRRVAKEFQIIRSVANWCSVKTMDENGHGKK
jgi:hypothetical protein